MSCHPTAHLLRQDDAHGVAWLTFNRPDARNATTQEMIDALMAALLQIENDRTVRCVVLQGAGPYFMAGGDIRQFESMASMSGAERKVAFEQRLTKNGMLFKILERMPQPVIASVRGGAAGAGLGFVLAADIVIAANDAKFVLAHVKVGASPDAACSYHLPRKIGAKRAKTMALLGQDIDAATALDWGMLDFTCNPGDLEAETQRLSQRLAAGPATSLAACKALVNASSGHSLEEQLAMEAVELGRCAATDDFLEGPRAYLEKRRPRFAS